MYWYPDPDNDLETWPCEECVILKGDPIKITVLYYGAIVTISELHPYRVSVHGFVYGQMNHEGHIERAHSQWGTLRIEHL